MDTNIGLSAVKRNYESFQRKSYEIRLKGKE